ncbi:MAG: hypothetical protein ACRENA_02615 [Vulcanimicrobiaceae bacterium]
MNERPDVADATETVPTISRDSSTENKEDVALLPESMLGDLRQRWDDVQAGFVDDPKSSVEKADELVEDAVRRLTQSFARERANLEATWSRGEQASTEDLRVALQRYRSFFNRLLST